MEVPDDPPTPPDELAVPVELLPAPAPAPAPMDPLPMSAPPMAGLLPVEVDALLVWSKVGAMLAVALAARALNASTLLAGLPAGLHDDPAISQRVLIGEGKGKGRSGEWKGITYALIAPTMPD